MDNTQIKDLSYNDLLTLYDKVKDFLAFLELETKNMEEDIND